MVNKVAPRLKNRTPEISAAKTKLPILAIVVPCFNEEKIIAKTNKCLRERLSDLIAKDKIGPASFILFVDDGSRDQTWQKIADLKNFDPQIRGIKLKHNFGQQKALLAGLYKAKDDADCVITLDADLQDDPKAIPKFIDLFLEGHDVVFGVRKDRQTDSYLKRHSARLFYKIMSYSNIKTIPNHAEYRLMSRESLERLFDLKSNNLFLRAVFPQLSVNSAFVLYDRKIRIGGKSKYSWWKMLSFGFQGLRFSFILNSHFDPSRLAGGEKSSHLSNTKLKISRLRRRMARDDNYFNQDI